MLIEKKNTKLNHLSKPLAKRKYGVHTKKLAFSIRGLIEYIAHVLMGCLTTMHTYNFG